MWYVHAESQVIGRDEDRLDAWILGVTGNHFQMPIHRSLFLWGGLASTAGAGLLGLAAPTRTLSRPTSVPASPA
jgi:hypothetical protein